MEFQVAEPNWRRHEGKYVMSLRHTKYGVVDLYVTSPSKSGDGDLVLRYADGPEDFHKVPINDYVGNWHRVDEVIDLAYLEAVALGLYNDTLH